jgi:colicin import membrane protein
MSDQKESSVLFSLKELMNIEEDRIKKEATDLEAKAAAERAAKEAADRTARESEERRIREEEDRRRSEEMRRREEAARLEAIQHGEVERARLEAEQRARMEAMAAQQRHEQQLATIQHQSGSKKLKVIVGVIGTVLVIGGIGFTLAIKANNEKAEREKAALAAAKLHAEEEARQLREDMAKAESKMSDLQGQLASAQSDAEKEALRRKIEAVQKEQQSIRSRQGGSPTPDKPPPPKKQCPPGDPLCSEL